MSGTTEGRDEMEAQNQERMSEVRSTEIQRDRKQM